MREACPQCGARMRHSRTMTIGKYVFRRRDCTKCTYADRSKFWPEVLLETVKVRKRTSAAPKTDVKGSITR